MMTNDPEHPEDGLRWVRLSPHPDTPCPELRGIEANVTHTEGGVLRLHYRAEGDIDAIRIPPPETPVRRDGLWEHTCFEAFLRIADEAAYREFNLSPSGAWAAYAFRDYREGGEPLVVETPRIQCRRAPHRIELEAMVVLDPSLFEPGSPLHLGLSAVIETEDGRRSYWALHHPSGRPDFHHADAFALELVRE